MKQPSQVIFLSLYFVGSSESWLSLSPLVHVLQKVWVSMMILMPTCWGTTRSSHWQTSCTTPWRNPPPASRVPGWLPWTMPARMPVSCSWVFQGFSCSAGKCWPPWFKNQLFPILIPLRVFFWASSTEILFSMWAVFSAWKEGLLSRNKPRTGSEIII